MQIITYLQVKSLDWNLKVKTSGANPLFDCFIIASLFAMTEELEVLLINCAQLKLVR